MLKKLYTLLIAQYLLFFFRSRIFIRNLPLDLPRADQMIKGTNIMPFLVLALYVLFFIMLKKGERNGYIFSFIISVSWILSIIAVFFYFYVADQLSAPFIILNIVWLGVCFTTIGILLNHDLKALLLGNLTNK